MFLKVFFVTLLLQEFLNYREKANVFGLDDLNNFDLMMVKNGIDTVNNDFPFVVSVRVSFFDCIGILVNSGFILTTATCANWSYEYTGIALSNVTLNDGESRNVEKIIFHPYYLKGPINTTVVTLYRFALLKLDSPVNKNQTIDLARNTTEKLVLRQVRCKVITDENPQEAVKFRSYNVTLIDWDECRTEILDLVDSNQVCAKIEGYEDVWITEGAPLICEGKAHGLFLSIDHSSPLLVFVRLDTLEDFLSSQERKLSENNILFSKAVVDNSLERTTSEADDDVIIISSTIKPLIPSINKPMKKSPGISRRIARSQSNETSNDTSLDHETSKEEIISSDKTIHLDASMPPNVSVSRNISSLTEEVGIFPSNVTRSLSNQTITSNVSSSEQDAFKGELPWLDKIKEIQGNETIELKSPQNVSNLTREAGILHWNNTRYLSMKNITSNFSSLYHGGKNLLGCAESSKATTTLSPPPSLVFLFVYSLIIGILSVSTGSYSLITIYS